MTTNAQIFQNGEYWYVVTPEGQYGPLESEQEAASYAKLLRIALAAGSETACTVDECLA